MTLRPRIPPGAPIPRRYSVAFCEADRAALLRPGRIGPMELRNRVALPAMESNLADRRGLVTERMVAYYRARAAGGAAWITTENTSVHASGRVAARMLRIEDDEQGAAFAPLVRAVHEAGSKVLVQLSHAGRQTLSEISGGAPWAPSAIPCPVMKDEPRAMSEADIELLIGCFVAGARRAQDAGADGVELHMAHGYLLCGFLSPDQNRRTDAFGGDTERRCAFPCAVLRSIRAACGGGFAIVARISADEYVEGGIDPDEALRIAPRLVAAGADALHVSAGNYESSFWNIPSYFLPEGTYVSLASRLKAALEVPIISVGRLHRPEVAARVLREGHADFVAVGRGMIADPRWLLRVQEGEVDQIRPCLCCNRCIASINGGKLECTVNPYIGFEALGESQRPGPVPEDAPLVVVVGGGPAGLMAAQAAHGSGHRVRLIEQRDELGGQLDLAAMPPGKEPVQWYLSWLLAWIEQARALGGLELILGRAAQPADLEGASRLLFAAGSRPRRFDFEGDERIPHLALDDAMRDPSLAGQRPLIVGAGAGGCEAAHVLALGGATVLLVEQKRKIARDLIPALRFHLKAELREAGVQVQRKVRRIHFEGRKALLDVRKEGTVEFFGVTAIIDAAGRAPLLPSAELSEAWDGEIERIGDALRPGSIYEAAAAAVACFRV